MMNGEMIRMAGDLVEATRRMCENMHMMKLGIRMRGRGLSVTSCIFSCSFSSHHLTIRRHSRDLFPNPSLNSGEIFWFKYTRIHQALQTSSKKIHSKPIRSTIHRSSISSCLSLRRQRPANTGPSKITCSRYPIENKSLRVYNPTIKLITALRSEYRC
jgi:hypothetical protein